MLVREVMSSPAFTVSADTSVREALRLLDEHAITALPVVDDADGIVGVVSEADLVREGVLPDVRTHMIPIHVTASAPARTVAEVMTRTVLTVSSASDLADAVDLMTATVVKSLPVVDGGRVVGVVSRRDVVRVLARRDESIRQDVDELVRSERVDWLVEVTDGVVSLAGPVDEHERRLAEALAGSVAGVVAVRVT
ncbi:MAG: CBS domain-containing protein [Nocardioidaceae bacterium]